MKTKDQILSFKLDEELYEKIKFMPDRSKFIRDAIAMALENTCPFCNGTGILDQAQKEHWKNLMKNHSLERCDDCGALFIKCNNEKTK